MSLILREIIATEQVAWQPEWPSAVRQFVGFARYLERGHAGTSRDECTHRRISEVLDRYQLGAGGRLAHDRAERMRERAVIGGRDDDAAIHAELQLTRQLDQS